MNKTFVFLIADYRYFVMHRLSLARAICEQGGSVIVITDLHGDAPPVQEPGIRILDLAIPRNIRPLADLRLLVRLVNLFRKLKPDLVQCMSLKCIFLGSFPALIARVPFVVNTVTGFGYLFSSESKLMAWLLLPALKFLVRHPRCTTVVENQHDYERVNGWVKARGSAQGSRRIPVALVRGAGVDIQRYRPMPGAGACDQPLDSYKVILPARLLWDKGVGEFVAAARALKKRDDRVQMILVGGPDESNPRTVTEEDIERWVQGGLVQHWGYRHDMPEVYHSAHIVCLPTYYHEGLPVALLEAAASAKAIIASDIPGCRELIEDRVNGLIIPPRNSEALADAVLELVHDDARRLRYGLSARETVVAGFSDSSVNSAYMALYESGFQC